MPFDKRSQPKLGGTGDDDAGDAFLREAVEIWEPTHGAVPSLGLVPGEVLSERFVVERLAGKGGMGAVYRANDLASQQPVAIKVVAPGGAGDSNRFAREVAVLAELSHPAIVHYLAHGTTEYGTPFLAMEWLEGESLSDRLAGAALRVEDSLAILRRACEGLCVSHARGIVHRDLKPSNLFLVDGDPTRLKVLDFGIAWHGAGTHTLTQSGTVLGTVGYMSPEQAMGARNVDARTDVFALGCVFFECLTGRAVFRGPNPVAVLAKVLREDATRISQLRAGLEPFDALLTQMLSKNAEQRPKDAAAILRALDALGPIFGAGLVGTPVSTGLTGSEHKIVSVILGELPSLAVARGAAAKLHANMNKIRELTRQFGAEPIAMRGGALLVVIAGRGAATDHASQAAQCALMLERLRLELRLGVATGRADTAGHIPVGAAIDRAAERLGADDSQTGIAIDELTASLLDPSFEIRRGAGRLWLVARHADFAATRLLLGKPTPFVGRDRELGLLELTLRECIDESVARAVLVIGPPGQGKSRLRQEFVARTRERGGVAIVIARADPVGAGSAFTLVRQILRQALGVREGDPLRQQHAKLCAHVAASCSGPDYARIVDFLAELIGVPNSAEPSPQLMAARNDPQIMALWLRRSFVQWLIANCALQPFVIVLEDLHWGDAPSVTYLGDALCGTSARNLMVLALARREVQAAFPKLWSGAETLILPLGRLTPRAAELLVRSTLGQQVTPSTLARVIERADGNAFYLEELIRRVADGGDQGLPETILAVVESRLARLESEARRVVRAASVFGEVFWRGGVLALLGASTTATDLESWLHILSERELFVAARESRFGGEAEYSFGHGLVREAAYAMLSDADRSKGHALAGDWLERAGDKDALTLAGHFEQGGERARAVPWLLSAAQVAADGGNVAESIDLAQRGMACGAQGSERAQLRLVQATGFTVVGNWVSCVDASLDALRQLDPGSTPWFRAIAAVLMPASFLGDSELTAAMLREIQAVRVQPEHSGPYGHAIYQVFQGLTRIGKIAEGRSVLVRAEAVVGELGAADPAFVMWLRNARARLELIDGNLAGALASAWEARQLADGTGGYIARGSTYLYWLTALSQTGHVERTAMAVRELQALGLDNQRSAIDWAGAFLAWARVVTGAAGEAIETFQQLLDRPDPFQVTSARAMLSIALLACDRVDEAAREADLALASAPFPWSQATGLRSRAAVELRTHRPAAALASAERGLAAAAHGSHPLTVSILQLTRAEALHALERREQACTAIERARERILQISTGLHDSELRTAYLDRIQVHVRTLQLARAWLGDAQPG